MEWRLFLVYLAVSAACCSIGFKKTVYFLSAGYGMAVAGLGIAYLATILHRGYPCGWVMVIQCVLLATYGLRLAIYLFYREVKFSSYRVILNNLKSADGHEPFMVRFGIWAGVSVLYILQTCPVFFRAYNGRGTDVALPLVGIVISVLGLLLENQADVTKSRLKRIDPAKPATKGVYRIVRCPNYLGEMIFWTGMFVGALNALQGGLQWTMAIGGYVMIIMIMFNSAQRLEKRQEARYGTDHAYRRYAQTTPILLPLVPLYTLGGRKKDAR